MTSKASLARESFTLLLDIHEHGELATHGFPSSNERVLKLIDHVATEATNILRQELETLTLEEFGGKTIGAKTAIRTVCALADRARQLDLPLEPTLSESLSRPTTTRRLLPRQSGG